VCGVPKKKNQNIEIAVKIYVPISKSTKKRGERPKYKILQKI